MINGRPSTLFSEKRILDTNSNALTKQLMHTNNNTHTNTPTLTHTQPKKKDDVFRLNIVNLLKNPTNEPLFDVTVVAEGRELKAHKCILAASSIYFQRLFCGQEAPTRLEFQQKWEVVSCLIMCLYGAGIDASLDAESILELLSEARNLEINCIDEEEACMLLRKHLNEENCMSILLHEELIYHSELSYEIAVYVSKTFLQNVHRPEYRSQLLQVSRQHFISILHAVCGECATDDDSETVVRFAAEWAEFATACDLLRDCKQWQWSLDPNRMSMFRSVPETSDLTSLRHPLTSKQLNSMPLQMEWRIPNLKKTLSNQLPMKYVCGHYFDWLVKMDHGAEGKIRIVYEAAVEVDANKGMCLRRFPAAMFAWQVIFRGSNVFHERPVFICFPQNVSLHWSTTVPIQTTDLTDDDELIIMINMVENPLVSLILYHFSADLSNTVAQEDILNRLPHIEYRCLSSYTLFQQVRSQADAMGKSSANAPSDTSVTSRH